MSDVERTRWWPPVREALLDLTWRDRYLRWYLILVLMWFFAQWIVLVRLINVERYPWLMTVGVITAWLGQRTIGKVIDTLKTWNEQQVEYDEEARRDLEEA